MFKSVCLCIAVIFLAGCTENSVHQVPPSEAAAGTNVVHVVPLPYTPPTPIRNPVPRSPSAPSAPLDTWISLRSWASERSLDGPRRITGVPYAAYNISSKNGTMEVEIGSRDAVWNGIVINLGFAPQLIDGEVSLHALDLEKNFEPLLVAPPLVFPTNQIIIIDPGHGGHNVGTQSVLDGRFEKDLTLDLAQRLKPLLEEEGWNVYLTRIDDSDVSLPDRVAFADEQKGALFISLHFNSSAPDKTQSGLETYCLTPTGEPSTVTRNYADSWNENLPNNAFDPENLQLAVRIHAALLHATGMEDRGVRRARFIGVLKGQNRPAILIENGYLSNPSEAKKIEDPEYRQKLAETLAAALAPKNEDRR